MWPRRCSSAARCAPTSRAGSPAGRTCCSPRSRWSSAAACSANGSAFRSCSGDWWFWLGNQGWEYLELGRFWQYLLVVGLAGLVRDAVVAGAAAHGGRAGSAAARHDVPGRGTGDPGVLHAGAVLRRQDQLHGGRHLALLDHPPVGGRLLRVLRHDGRGADVLPTRPDPPQHRAAGDLSRRDPVLPRRPDRHRPPLVFHRPHATSTWRCRRCSRCWKWCR